MDYTFPLGLVRLNITRFLGAFNDNLFKLLIIGHPIRMQGSGFAETVA